MATVRANKRTDRVLTNGPIGSIWHDFRSISEVSRSQASPYLRVVFSTADDRYFKSLQILPQLSSDR